MFKTVMSLAASLMLIATAGSVAGQPAGPEVTPKPEEAFIGELLKTRGQLFAYAASECRNVVDLKIEKPNGDKIDIGSADVRPDGTFLDRWRVRNLRSNKQYTVQAVQRCDPGVLVASSGWFRVVEPFLEALPSYLFMDETTKIRGTTWNPRSKVCAQKVKLIATKGDLREAIKVTALNARAAFAFNWTVQLPETGTWRVRGIQSCRQAGRSFKIRASAPLQVQEAPPEEPG